MKDTNRRATTLEEAIAELEDSIRELNEATREYRSANPFLDWSAWDALEQQRALAQLPDPMDEAKYNNEEVF